MNEKIIEPSTFVAAMQDILTAPSPGSLLQAVHNVNAHLTVLPVEQVLAQSGQFLSLRGTVRLLRQNRRGRVLFFGKDFGRKNRKLLRQFFLFFILRYLFDAYPFSEQPHTILILFAFLF